MSDIEYPQAELGLKPEMAIALLDVVDAAEELAKAVAYSKLANYNQARAKLNKLMEGL